MSTPSTLGFKVALFSGSLRKNSLNTKLLNVIDNQLRKANVESHVIDLAHYNLPVINEDLIIDSKLPEPVTHVGEILKKCAAIVCCTPEYNGTISAVTKNLIDWTSCMRPHPWAGKCVFIAAATPGPMSALRGLWHSRQAFEVLGAHVYPEMFGLGLADQHLAQPLTIADPKTAERLSSLVDRFVRHARKSMCD